MRETKKSNNLGCLVALLIIALIAGALSWFWDDLINPMRGGAGPYKDYPELVKRGVQSNSVRHKPR